MKQAYIEAVDAWKQSRSKHVGHNAGIAVVRHIESCLLLASKRKEIPASTEALKIPFIDSLKLEAELKSLPVIIGLYNATADVRLLLLLFYSYSKYIWQ